MQTTPNLGLKKPDGTDNVSRVMFNENSDIIDTQVAKLVSTTEPGRMSAADKVKLNGIAAGANAYAHPATHPPSIIVQDSSNRFTSDAEKSAWNAKAGTTPATTSAAGLMSAADKSKLDGVAAGANAYVHPSTHPATMIVEDAAHRFVTDADKADWDAKPQRTTANITYYVRTDGNDNNTGLVNTAAGAFKTIAKAVSMIPQVVNHTVDIRIASGSYAEVIMLGGFMGSGNISIVGPSATKDAVIPGADLTHCTCRVGFYFMAPSSTSRTTIAVEQCIFAQIESCVITGATGANFDGIRVVNSKVEAVNNIINDKSGAITAAGRSEVSTWNNSGSGNLWSYWADATSSINVGGGTVPGSANGHRVTGGGLILSADGAINPWGDNTRYLRSMAVAFPTAVTTLTNATTWYKILFGNKAADNLSEFNTSLSRFTSGRGGNYLINASVEITNLASGDRVIFAIYRNGSLEHYVGNLIYSGLAAGTANVSSQLILAAGDYIELYAYINNGTGGKTINSAGVVTYLRICQIA